MGNTTLGEHQYQQAIAAIESESATSWEKAEMLMQIAMGLQQKPKSSHDLHNAVDLYDRALQLCRDKDTELAARIRARKGTALQSIPAGNADYLLRAQIEFEAALAMLEGTGAAEEIAEINMNLGLVLQNLAAFNKAAMSAAIHAYQNALRTFKRTIFPTEYAILHNNLATAYLSIPMSDERAKMREALAVQSFEEALKVVSIAEQPSEYAMLQNNLGNALQYASSSHVTENNLRALEAYAEALRVRTATDTPLEYANTICNQANCLRNLPDNIENPAAGNIENRLKAETLYREAKEIFQAFGDTEKVAVIHAALTEIQLDAGAGTAGPQTGKDFGENRIY